MTEAQRQRKRELREAARVRNAKPAPKINTTLIQSIRPDAMSIVVIGAGGIGARVIPGLIKLCRPNLDHIHVLDHDVVEPKNLPRQNFQARDVGFHKAEVMANRYATEALPVIAHLMKVEDNAAGRGFFTDLQENDNTPPSLGQHPHTSGLLVLSCVDTREARRAIGGILGGLGGDLGYQIAWIDVGNDMRSGQCLISTWRWPIGSQGRITTHMKMNGYDAMPQVFVGVEDVGEGCLALDLQTMTVNNTAACTMLNAAAWILHGIPFGSCGSIFTTFNTMEPIQFGSVGTVNYNGDFVVRPSTKFRQDVEGAPVW